MVGSLEGAAKARFNAVSLVASFAKEGLILNEFLFVEGVEVSSSLFGGVGSLDARLMPFLAMFDALVSIGALVSDDVSGSVDVAVGKVEATSAEVDGSDSRGDWSNGFAFCVIWSDGRTDSVEIAVTCCVSMGAFVL